MEYPPDIKRAEKAGVYQEGMRKCTSPRNGCDIK
jgi:hypothetical protein